MNETNLIRAGRLVILLTVQVFILNHVHIVGYITPLLMGYMLICFQSGASRIGLLVWGFLAGLMFDIFSGTAGMASAGCTLLAMMQPALLRAFAPHDADDHFVPCIRTMGFGKYFTYAFLCMFVLHAVFYLLDAFTLHDWPMTLASVGGGTLVATLLCIFTELLVRKKRH